MKPSKLLRHMNAKHLGVKDKSLEYFERKKTGTRRTEEIYEGHHINKGENAVRASYLV
ncbi:zinc finger MYM-type protein 6, partial [Trichonephila inaurata madagascariensis]